MCFCNAENTIITSYRWPMELEEIDVLPRHCQGGRAAETSKR